MRNDVSRDHSGVTPNFSRSLVRARQYRRQPPHWNLWNVDVFVRDTPRRCNRPLPQVGHASCWAPVGSTSRGRFFTYGRRASKIFSNKTTSCLLYFAIFPKATSSPW
jgi:hypothetical protein